MAGMSRITPSTCVTHFDGHRVQKYQTLELEALVYGPCWLLASHSVNLTLGKLVKISRQPGVELYLPNLGDSHVATWPQQSPKLALN